MTTSTRWRNHHEHKHAGYADPTTPTTAPTGTPSASIGITPRSALGVHRHDGCGEVERCEQYSYDGDLVALDGDGDLPQDRCGGVVERRDQIRRAVRSPGRGRAPRPERGEPVMWLGLTARTVLRARPSAG